MNDILNKKNGNCEVIILLSHLSVPLLAAVFGPLLVTDCVGWTSSLV